MWRDASGREWSTAVTGATIKRVKELTDVLLTDAATGDLWGRLATDVILLCDVLYAVCKPQCDERGVSDCQFGELLAGEVIDAAHESLERDLIDFFPSRRRDPIRRMAAATRKMEQAGLQLIERKLTDEQIEALIRHAAQQAEIQIDDSLLTCGGPIGKSPEPSE